MTTGMDAKGGEAVEYKLPDGEVVEIGQERLMAPEILFNPAMAGLEYSGLHEFLNSSIKKLDLDLRKNLYKSIVLSGGNTQINGFADRIAKEIEGLVADQTIVEIISAKAQKQYLAWQGASSITNVNSFSKLWISKKEFQDEGDRIFLMKSF